MWPCHEKDWDVQDTFRARRACVHMCVCAHVHACVCVCVCSVVSNSLQSHGLQPARLLCPWDSPGKNTGMDCHSLLQWIFLTQGLNSGLLHCRWILCHLNPQGNPQELV